nr:PREDICTED: phospholipid-transporting ATPase ID [Lepisosteus oculatus]
MTIPKDIPEKWFPMVVPLKRKKAEGSGCERAGASAAGAEEERRVKANDREYNEKFQYANNCIMTSKYNIITFLPVNLFEQFQEVANTYFLFLLILQLIPQISSLSWFTTIVPLVLVLSITAVKDATDDYFRHKSDKQVNNRQSQVLINGILQKEKWMNVRVGDIIKLENNQFVAADLLLLSSSEPHGLCYIETAELDGETNMKVRQSLPVTSELGDPERLARFDGEVVCEPPNNKLDRFCGTLYWQENKYGLSNQNMLLRGCVLRNTESCYGLVIFAGPDTKLMQNSGRTKFKRTSIDRLMNTLVLWIFGFLVCMGVILSIGNAVWEKEVGSLFQIYLPWDQPIDNFLFSGFLSFWSYVIILNTVVPISLYVSVEVIRLGHSYFINWDRKMYCQRRNTPAEARTTTLNEELGQVEYIFSDKTGTLTQNIMTFNKCSINGKAYGEVIDTLGSQPKMTTRAEPLDFSFNPLADSRFSFCDQSLLEAVKLDDPATHEFFRLLSLCHTVMAEEKSEGELLYKAQSPDEGALVTAARNFGFVFRSRTPGTITVQELGRPVTYTLLAILDFNNIRKRMSVIVRNPEGRIRLYCKGADTLLFERLHPCNQDLLNITSDHLNEYAVDGLRTLALAYRDLSDQQYEEWALRHQSASRAADCREERLAAVYEDVEQDMMLLGATAIEDKLQEGVPETIAILTLANIKIWVLTGDKQETAVNIGYSCKMLTDDMSEVFIISGHTVQSVREELRRARERMLELARSMGNGYSWQEKGNPPRPPSTLLDTLPGDYALVINGHSLAHALEADMEREFLETACACKAVICCRVTPLQKALVVELIKRHKKAVTLAIGDGANDVSMIKTWSTLISVSLCQDVPEHRSLEYPKLYEPGQLNLLFNKREFFICIAQGIYTSVVLFFVPYGVFAEATRSDGTPLADYQTFAVTVATSLVIVVSVQIGLDTGYWTAINHFFILGSLGTYFTILFAMHSETLFSIFPNQFRFAGETLGELGICTLAHLFQQVRYTQLVRKKQKPRSGTRGTLGRMGRGGSRRSGYAFAHQEGFGELITSGKNMRLSSLALSSFATRHSASWIDTLRKKRSAASGGESPSPASQEPPEEGAPTPPLPEHSASVTPARSPASEGLSWGSMGLVAVQRGKMRCWIVGLCLSVLAGARDIPDHLCPAPVARLPLKKLFEGPELPSKSPTLGEAFRLLILCWRRELIERHRVVLTVTGGRACDSGLPGSHRPQGISAQ